MVTCERCGATVTGPGHRHRVTVRVPVDRYVGGKRHASFERVTVVADVWVPGGAILRAMARVHGPDAFWWGDRGTPDVGQVMRADGPSSSTSVTGRVPAPVVEWTVIE